MSESDRPDVARLSREAVEAWFKRTWAESDAMRERIAELEAEVALLRGTLAREAPETPTQITHDVPPDAPR